MSTLEFPICDCFDKRCINNYLSDVKEAKIKMPNGLVTNIKDHKYIVCDKFFTITSGAEEVFTELLVKILSLGEYELLNYEDGYKGLMEAYSIF